MAVWSTPRARAAELLEQFSLADAGGRAVKTYSRGMRRRLPGGGQGRDRPVRGRPEVTRDAVSAQVSDPRLPPAVLQRLTDADVAVAELSLRKPSLDEVFFALTGHHTDDDADWSAVA